MFRSPRFYLPLSGVVAGCGMMAAAHYKVIQNDEYNNSLLEWGTKLAAASGFALIVLHYPIIVSNYNERSVARQLRSCRPRASVGYRPLFPSRQTVMDELLTRVCDAFRDHQQFLVVYGSKGVGKTELVKNSVQFINNLNDETKKDEAMTSDGILGEDDFGIMAGLGTVYVHCKENATPTSVLNALLDGFSPRLSETARGTINGVKSFAELEKLLRRHLPTDSRILIVIDGVKSRFDWVNDLNEFTRDMSETPNGGAQVKVLLVCCDAFDVAMSSAFRKEGRADKFFVDFPSAPQLEEFVHDFCEENGAIIPSAQGDEEDQLARIARELKTVDWNLPVLKKEVLKLCFRTTSDGQKILDVELVKQVTGSLEYTTAKLTTVVDKCGLAVKIELLNFLKQEIMTAGDTEAAMYKEISYDEFQEQMLKSGVPHDALRELVEEELAVRHGEKIIFHPQLVTLAHKYGRKQKKPKI